MLWVVGANEKAARKVGATGAVTRAHHAARAGALAARRRVRRCLCADRLDADLLGWEQ